MRKLIVILGAIILIILSTEFSHSQSNLEWQRSYSYTPSDNKGKCIEVDNLGNSVVSGLVLGDGVDIITLKYDPSGNLLWSKRYTDLSGYLSDDGVSDMVVDNQRNIYVAGYTANSIGGNKNFLTIKYSPSGSVLWERKYQALSNYSDKANALCLDANGNVYVAGYSMGVGTAEDYQLVKYDNNGNLQWVRRYNSPHNNVDIANDMDVDIAGNVYVTGQSYLNNSTYFTIKYSSSGDELWTRRSGTINHNDVATSISVDKSQNAYVTGTSNGVLIAGKTYKYDIDGNEVWAASYEKQQDIPIVRVVDEDDVADESNIVVSTSNNEFYQITGYDFLTIKYDGISGDMLWKRRFNHDDNSFDNVHAMTVDSDGNVYVTGKSYDSTSKFDIATIKYDGTSGNTLWYQRYNTSGNINDYANDIAIGPSGSVHLAGEFNNSTNIIHVLKYSQNNITPTLSLKCLIQGFFNSVIKRTISDTVEILLRDIASPYNVVDSSKGVLSHIGKGVFSFSNAVNGTPYYIVVRHRNSLETWSAGGVAFSSNALAYDFTSAANKAYGDNLILNGGKYCIYSGDCNKDGSVDGTDMLIVDNDASIVATGYIQSDLNGDGYADGSDVLIAENNASNYVAVRNPIVGMSPGISHIRDLHSRSASTFKLQDNYPNPFNPSTEIRFSLAENVNVNLKVYDMSGKEVAVLVNEMKTAGEHSIMFNASGLSSGTYFYKLTAGSVEQVKKMTLVK
jgi:hypothetical protein